MSDRSDWLGLKTLSKCFNLSRFLVNKIGLVIETNSKIVRIKCDKCI